ncbi:MAG: galactose-1-phosphate uridylyltransferase [Proteobacteria bacterium]|nr:MAG: galactose-1-phosphate uridylyltransferase [Pseudomonadota bacterium]
MYQVDLKKPDGRKLFLYSNRPIPSGIEPTNPEGPGNKAEPHMRWHPLRGEWVTFASHRQGRTFLPPKDYSPLAVTKTKDFPTEMPQGDYEVAVFENLFPSFRLGATSAPELSVPTKPAEATCEVVVFSKDADETLGQLSVERIRLILEVIGQRSKALGEEQKIKYVLPFENRGVEMGVTLHHPHGQIYSYPFVPPVPERMMTEMKKHWDQTGNGLYAQMIEDEIKDGRRLIHREKGAVAFVPPCARYPYETWVSPERPVSYLSDLSLDELDSLARTLKTVILKHDGLWDRPQPYLLVMYQAPYDGEKHPEAHVHFQIYPPYRTKDRLKYLAGTELGAGTYINDSIPEEKAAELRDIVVAPFGLGEN